MGDKIKGIIYLTVLYRLIMGEWPDPTDLHYQMAVQKCLTTK